MKFFAVMKFFALMLLLTVMVQPFTLVTAVSAASLYVQPQGDSLSKDTEAIREKQALQKDSFSSENQPIEIIGLFGYLGASSQFLTVLSSGKVSLWTPKKAQEIEILASGEPALACAYSPKRNILALSQDKGVSIFDLKTKGRLKMSPDLGTKAAALDFSPDGNSLLIGGEDGKVYRWKINLENLEETANKIEIERYVGHSAAVTSLAYHPLNRLFFSADSFGTLAAWLTYDKDLFAGKYDERLNQTTYYTDDGPSAVTEVVDATTALAIRISKDGQNLFVALQDGRIEWRLVRGLKLVVKAQVNKGAIYDLQLSPSGKLMASVARDGVVRVWKTTFLEKPGELPKNVELTKDLNDFKKDSLGYFTLVKEFPINAARKLLFLSDDSLIVAESGGRLLELSL